MRKMTDGEVEAAVRNALHDLDADGLAAVLALLINGTVVYNEAEHVFEVEEEDEIVKQIMDTWNCSKEVAQDLAQRVIALVQKNAMSVDQAIDAVVKERHEMDQQADDAIVAGVSEDWLRAHADDGNCTAISPELLTQVQATEEPLHIVLFRTMQRLFDALLNLKGELNKETIRIITTQHHLPKPIAERLVGRVNDLAETMGYEDAILKAVEEYTDD